VSDLGKGKGEGVEIRKHSCLTMLISPGLINDLYLQWFVKWNIYEKLPIVRAEHNCETTVHV